MPIFGAGASAIQSIFVERGGSQSERDALVSSFIQRQNAIEVEDEPWNPICIFAEGTTTNAQRLLPFKRGAFQGMRSIVPSFFSISSG